MHLFPPCSPCRISTNQAGWKKMHVPFSEADQPAGVRLQQVKERTLMFRILGSRKTLCDGLTRRDVLQIGTLGCLTLGDWFRLQAGEPVTSKPNFGKAKSCILLYLFGAPSQHDTFDPKPDAPIGIRGELQNPIA